MSVCPHFLPIDQGWGIFNRQNEEFSTGVDRLGRLRFRLRFNVAASVE
jgi:hypothetical protein